MGKMWIYGVVRGSLLIKRTFRTESYPPCWNPMGQPDGNDDMFTAGTPRGGLTPTLTQT